LITEARNLTEAGKEWWQDTTWDDRTEMPLGFEVLKQAGPFSDTEVGAVYLGKSGKDEGPVSYSVAAKVSPVKGKPKKLTMAELEKIVRAGIVKPHGEWGYYKMTINRPKRRRR